MSGAVRFLGMAVLTWAAVRAISLGLVPGTRAAADPLASALTDPNAAAATGLPGGLPPIAATDLLPDALRPVAVAGAAPALVDPQPLPAAAPSIRPAAFAAPRRWATRAVGERPFADPAPGLAPLDPYGVAVARIDLPPADPRAGFDAGAVFAGARSHAATRPQRDAAAPAAPVALAAAAVGRAGQSQVVAGPALRQSVSPAIARRLDRIQLSMWGLMRPGLDAPGVARAGTLGGSQGGARLDYRLTPHLAATVRVSSAMQGPRGAEVAPGLRYRPFARHAVSLIVERRRAVGRYGGRNAFALLAEGGIWARPMPAGFALDAYVQAGLVGLRHRRTPFADGALTLTRPLVGKLRGGAGVWAGAQPHLWRIDAGPRLSLPVAPGLTAHLDWRQRIAGRAAPGSGATATLAADF